MNLKSTSKCGFKSIIVTRELNKKEFLDLCVFLEGFQSESFFYIMDMSSNRYTVSAEQMKRLMFLTTSPGTKWLTKCRLLIKDKNVALQVKLRYG